MMQYHSLYATTIDTILNSVSLHSPGPLSDLLIRYEAYLTTGAYLEVDTNQGTWWALGAHHL